MKGTIAHMPPLTKGRRISGQERDALTAKLRKQYDKGVSIRELASETGRSYGFVHRLLVESGTQLRGRGGANRRSAPTAKKKKAPAKKK